MHRLVLALALAAFPLIATSQQKTQAVTVTNPVVPVEIRNADAVPVVQQPASVTPAQLFTTAGGAGTSGTTFNLGTVIQADAILTGLMVDIRTGGTAGTCSILFQLADSGFRPIVTAVGQLAARAGEWRSSPFIPLPNIAVPAGTLLLASGTNSTGEMCNYSAVIHGLKN